MKHKMLVIDVDERIRKFNNSVYSELLNTNDLSEQVRCEIIVKKCSPFLMMVLIVDICGLMMYIGFMLLVVRSSVIFFSYLGELQLQNC